MYPLRLQFKDFDFDVDPSAFSQMHRPVASVRLVVIDRGTGSIQFDEFPRLPEYLCDRDDLVFNDVGIAPSRLLGTTDSGAEIDLCFLMHDSEDTSRWEVVILGEEPPPRSGRFSLARGRVRGEFLGKISDFEGSYWLERNRYHGYRGRVSVDVLPAELRTVLTELGSYMHPWYTDLNALPKPQLNPAMATTQGSALLSEPSRRMTPALRAACRARGVGELFVSIRLAFAWRPNPPSGNLSDCVMNPEEIEVSEAGADAINRAHAARRRLIAVGTGPARVLESLPSPARGYRGRTSLFIAPGHIFRHCQGLLTNLHVPMSTHVIMASAFGSRELVLDACSDAARQGFQFGIHGDAMLLLCDHEHR